METEAAGDGQGEETEAGANTGAEEPAGENEGVDSPSVGQVEHKQRAAAEAEAESRQFWEEHAGTWRVAVEEEARRVAERSHARLEYKRMLQVGGAGEGGG